MVIGAPPLEMGVLFSMLTSRFPLIVTKQASKDVQKEKVA
jgi:hypothetical protein